MRLINLEDLLPLEEYALQRRELFEKHLEFLNRFRKIQLGPDTTLVFENRQTLIFKLQEILLVSRIGDPIIIQKELDVFNRLIPPSNTLQASLLFSSAKGKIQGQLDGKELRLQIGEVSVPGDIVTARPGDMAIGTSFWAQFCLKPSQVQGLSTPELAVSVTLNWGMGIQFEQVLTLEIRQSLNLDLV